MKAKDIIKVAALKPRDPNQAVLASKRNAGGPMRDKKREQKRGEAKHKSKTFEDQDGDVIINRGVMSKVKDLLSAVAVRQTRIPDRIFDKARELQHEFVNAGLGRWMISLYKHADKVFAAVYPPDRSGTKFFEPMMQESLEEGRRHVYGPGDTELKDHPNKDMQALHKGPLKVHTKNGYAKAVKVQWFNGGMNYKLDRQVQVDGEPSYWVPAEHVKVVHEDVVMEKRPAGAPKWHDSDAPDANGKFKELGVNDLADWLIKTRGGDARKIYGSINQQIVFNRKKNPSYAKKMESVRDAVKRKLVAKVKESLMEELNLLAEGWDNMKDGQGTFTADMSMVDHHMGQGGKLRCPGCRASLDLKGFKVHKDGEGDTTMWSLNHDCGAKLKIWNT